MAFMQSLNIEQPFWYNALKEFIARMGRLIQKIHFTNTEGKRNLGINWRKEYQAFSKYVYKLNDASALAFLQKIQE